MCIRDRLTCFAFKDNRGLQSLLGMWVTHAFKTIQVKCPFPTFWHLVPVWAQGGEGYTSINLPEKAALTWVSKNMLIQKYLPALAGSANLKISQSGQNPSVGYMVLFTPPAMKPLFSHHRPRKRGKEQYLWKLTLPLACICRQTQVDARRWFKQITLQQWIVS